MSIGNSLTFDVNILDDNGMYVFNIPTVKFISLNRY